MELRKMLKPQRLGNLSLPDMELTEDKKTCRKFGPCGVGKKAIYLNSFYIERRYYVPMKSVKRIFKRIAMSKGGLPVKVHLARCLISWLNMMMAKKSSAILNMRRMWTACLLMWRSTFRRYRCTVRLRSKNSRRRQSGWKKSSVSEIFQKLQRKISAVSIMQSNIFIRIQICI